MIDFEIEPYVEKPDLPWCQIYDIDGTLALRGDRGPYEWDKVHLDNVNHPVRHIVNTNLISIWINIASIISRIPFSSLVIFLFPLLLKNNLVFFYFPPTIFHILPGSKGYLIIHDKI